MASIRKRKNNFASLLSKDSNFVSPADVKNEAVSFFKLLFQEESPIRPTFSNLEFRKLLPWQSAKLTEAVTHEEIDQAVYSCDSQKSPGPDGFNFYFIKHTWEIIKNDFYLIVEKLWASDVLPKGCNTALIALIAKVESPSGFKDSRQISVIGCIYKIISKILARRLQAVMDHLVSPFQSSFIKGRQILDCALIASELIDSLKNSKREAVIFKLDFHKAFDSVSWSFIDWTLSQMNFPPLWRKWISACITSASASILVNGSPTIPFMLQRGLRQGDPLSPFLFDLAVEVLNLLIHHAINKNMWKGISVGKDEIMISHLQYADDTILFCTPDISSLLNIKKSLILFDLVSGLHVNFHKSSIMGINVSEEWIKNSAEILMCKRSIIPFSYLGLPIGGSTHKLAIWDPILKRIRKKLASWKGKLLSLGGRLTLIKSSMANLPLYFMSLFPMPKGIIEKITKIQRNFLWGGSEEKSSIPLVAWRQIALPKLLGGLSIGNLLHRNIAMLFKWIWRYFSCPKSLWRQVIQSKYNYPSSLLITELQIPNKGGPWRSICKAILSHPIAKTFSLSKTRKKIGDGASTSFWHEIWLGPSPLKTQFPRLFSISSGQNASIAMFGFWNGLVWQWSFHWARTLRPRDIQEFEQLSCALEEVSFHLLRRTCKYEPPVKWASSQSNLPPLNWIKHPALLIRNSSNVSGEALYPTELKCSHGWFLWKKSTPKKI